MSFLHVDCVLCIIKSFVVEGRRILTIPHASQRLRVVVGRSFDDVGGVDVLQSASCDISGGGGQDGQP